MKEVHHNYSALWTSSSIDSETTKAARSEIFQAVNPIITPEMNQALVAALDPAEVMDAIRLQPHDKAPGPDGIGGRFYWEMKDVIQSDLFQSLQQFFKFRRLCRSWQQTIVTLIPKLSPGSSTAQSFRPIGLCNSSYKILATILLQRWKKCLRLSIDEAQFGFVEGRDIVDCVMTVQEIWHTINSQKNNKRQFFVGKIDMDKAYDRLSWSFVQGTLNAMGYSAQWIRWIMQCISTVESRIRVNDELSDTIQLRMGYDSLPIHFYHLRECTDFSYS